MQRIRVRPSSLSGTISAPPSKSHSLRAILFAALAEGNSLIKNVLSSPDIDAMIGACRSFGAFIHRSEDRLEITGVSGRLQVKPNTIIDAGNSGQVLRYITAVLATQDESVTVTGDASICSSRPIKPYLDSFDQLGVQCHSINADNYAPLVIKGPFQGRKIKVEGEDSQIVTGLCIAAVLVSGETEIQVHHPGEKPWIDLTIEWLERLGVAVSRQDYHKFVVTGKRLSAFDYTVPGDFSSLAFPCVAALITQSVVQIDCVDWQDTQGDKALFYALKKLGADLSFDQDKMSLAVGADAQIAGGRLDINDYIDAITILAVVGCYALKPIHLTGAAIAREKECDRIEAICLELTKMGAKITPTADGLVAEPCALRGAVVQSHADHRIVMSLAVAAMAVADGETVIEDTTCVSKSYPCFVEHMRALGADIEVIR